MSSKVVGNVFEYSRQRSSALVVLLALADMADADGLCWPAHKTLAAMTNMSRRSVQRMLDFLEAEGEIVIFNRFDDKSAPQQYSNVYWLRKYGTPDPAACDGKWQELRGQMTMRPCSQQMFAVSGVLSAPKTKLAEEAAQKSPAKRMGVTSDAGSASSVTRGVDNSVTDGASHVAQKPSVEPSIEPSVEPARARATTPQPLVAEKDDIEGVKAPVQSTPSTFRGPISKESQLKGLKERKPKKSSWGSEPKDSVAQRPTYKPATFDGGQEWEWFKAAVREFSGVTPREPFAEAGNAATQRLRELKVTAKEMRSLVERKIRYENKGVYRYDWAPNDLPRLREEWAMEPKTFAPPIVPEPPDPNPRTLKESQLNIAMILRELYRKGGMSRETAIKRLAPTGYGEAFLDEAGVPHA